MKLLTRIKILIGSAVLLMSCGHTASVPTTFSESDQQPITYPDYAGVTVPCNIAPLNFAIEIEANDYVTRIKAGQKEWVIGGQSVMIDPEDWEEMKQTGDRLSVEVFTEHDGKWIHHLPFPIHVSKDSIDPYISYRLISPSYVTYEGLTINQRCLETFDESLIYGNMINTNEQDGQCINCHSFQQYDPNRMQFHVRQYLGGTVISYDGKTEKIDLKVAPGQVSAGVYPAWHPTLPLIAYSTNRTGQTFHTYDPQKIEVQDTYSDLILYDVEQHEVLPLEKDTNDLDCFPYWDPAGKYLYYCSAHYEQKDSSQSKEMDLIINYQDVHYNLYRRSFDAESHTFGPREMVYDCADTCSATLPRISPDGRYLMFTRGDYGVFHIWHSSSELYLLPLQEDGASARCITELNSPEVESYHSWSSNGRWVIFSSRRYDGNFTRPFIAHFNADGTFDRPFELPQEDPRYHQMFLRSYNIPEFMKGPVTIRPQDLAVTIAGDTVNVTVSPLAPKTDATTGATKQVDATTGATKQADATTGASPKK